MELDGDIMGLNNTFGEKTKFRNIRAGKTALCLALGLIFAISAGLMYIYGALSAVSPGSKEKVVVTIPRGANTYQISYLLEEKGLIKNRRAFVCYTRLTGLDSKLKSGKYSLSPGYTVPELVNLLVAGTKDTVVFTVPEGYTIEQICKLLEEKGLVERELFYYLVSKGDFSFPFVEDLPEGPARLEGYLFPDTYHVGSNSSEREIIRLMLQRFWREMQELDFPRKAAEKGLTLHEAVTIASMVEREAKVDRERPIIAGVIFNRLKLGMPLQIDATVQYALKGHRSKLYYKDLKVDSPYNTYRITGLPPGPIGAPGRKSLLAVLEPEKTDYLYYVAKPDGTHAFAKTLQEHNANIRKYQ